LAVLGSVQYGKSPPFELPFLALIEVEASFPAAFFFFFSCANDAPGKPKAIAMKIAITRIMRCSSCALWGYFCFLGPFFLLPIGLCASAGRIE